jgi:hypothetical protein
VYFLIHLLFPKVNLYLYYPRYQCGVQAYTAAGPGGMTGRCRRTTFTLGESLSMFSGDVRQADPLLVLSSQSFSSSCYCTQSSLWGWPRASMLRWGCHRHESLSMFSGDVRQADPLLVLSSQSFSSSCYCTQLPLWGWPRASMLRWGCHRHRRAWCVLALNGCLCTLFVGCVSMARSQHSDFH